MGRGRLDGGIARRENPNAMRTRHGLIAAGGVAFGVVLGAGVGFKAGVWAGRPGVVRVAPVQDGWRVLRVIDGDTLVIDGYDGEPTSVRLLGIDAPERGEPGHAEATAGLRDLVERSGGGGGGGVVWLVFDPGANRGRKRDSFGRLLCRVEVEGSGGERIDVGAALLERGLVRPYDR